MCSLLPTALTSSDAVGTLVPWVKLLVKLHQAPAVACRVQHHAALQLHPACCADCAAAVAMLHAIHLVRDKGHT